MEKLKAFEYTVEGFEDLNKFARGVLAMVNLKSCRKGTVVDVKTHEGTNLITIISLVEMDSYLNDFVGKITDKEDYDIVNLDFDDLKNIPQKTIADLEIEVLEYFVGFEIATK